MDTKKPSRNRQHATAACRQCRKSRIRCVLDPDSKNCESCRGKERECVFEENDGRKSRAVAKASEETLLKRIRDLERQLSEQKSSEISNTSPTDSEEASSVVANLMPSAIRFDMASGRVRYFGSTTHMNVVSRIDPNRDPPRRDPHWPIALVVQDLSPETHDYLMDLFWSLHNAVIHLVHSEAFYKDQEQGGVEFYSTFLHLTMLATGFRYAEKSREDIRRLALLGPGTSTLLEKAKSMSKLEIDRPGGIPSIQAFQLLGGLEFCRGNDDTAWLYTGMCYRMVFDAGLHVDPGSLNMPERDTQIRHMVLWACMTTDRLWALYLGRPTTLKTSDIAPSCLSFDFGRMVVCRSLGPEKKSVTRIYEALLRMLELISQLCDLRGPRPPKSMETNFKLAAIDQQLRDWHLTLPSYLQWSLETHEPMPPPYYFLHTQYHAALILLHRPFVRYSQTSEREVNSHFTSLSRGSCVESAKQIAVIFEQYRSRFDLAQIFGTGVQHAGTAATALMGEIVLQTDTRERAELLQSLSSIRLSISEMSKNYRPAELMTSVVDQFIRSIQNGKNRQPQQQPPKRSANGEVSVAGTRIEESQGVFSLKRARADSSYSFTPGTQSPSGLPFLPSSFLEGLSAEDSLFNDLAGIADGTCFQWDYSSGLL